MPSPESNCPKKLVAAKVVIFLLSVCCQSMLFLIYTDFISPIGAYMGLVYVPLSRIELVTAISFGAMISLFIPLRINRAGCLVLWYFYIVIIMPYLLISMVQGRSTNLIINGILGMVVPYVLICVFYDKINFKIIKLKRVGISVNQYAMLVAVFAFISSMILYYNFKHVLTLDFINIYDRRMLTREVVPDGSMFAYLSAQLGSFLLPACFACTWVVGRIKFFILPIGIAGVLLLFSLFGSKSALFLPFLMLVVGYIASKKTFKPSYIISIMIGFLAFSYLIDKIFAFPFFNYTINRRMFYIPVLLYNNYIEYFTNNGYLYFTDLRIFGYLFGVEGHSAAILVGENYMDELDLNANVGSIQYGFAEMGIFGCWIISLLVFTYLKIFDALSYGLPAPFCFSIAMLVAFKVTEQSFQTSMLTGGLGLLLFSLIFLKSRSSKQWLLRRSPL